MDLRKEISKDAKGKRITGAFKAMQGQSCWLSLRTKKIQSLAGVHDLSTKLSSGCIGILLLAQLSHTFDCGRDRSAHFLHDTTQRGGIFHFCHF